MEEFLSSAWRELGISGLTTIALIIYIWKNSDGKLIDVILQQSKNDERVTDNLQELKEQGKLFGTALLGLQQQLITLNNEQTKAIISAIQEQSSNINQGLDARIAPVVSLKDRVDEMIHVGVTLRTLLETNIPQEAE